MYLVTDAGSAYHVVGVEDTSNPRYFNFVCEKVERESIPAGSWVVGMYWKSRGR